MVALTVSGTKRAKVSSAAALAHLAMDAGSRAAICEAGGVEPKLLELGLGLLDVPSRAV